MKKILLLSIFALSGINGSFALTAEDPIPVYKYDKLDNVDGKTQYDHDTKVYRRYVDDLTAQYRVVTKKLIELSKDYSFTKDIFGTDPQRREAALKRKEELENKRDTLESRLDEANKLLAREGRY